MKKLSINEPFLLFVLIANSRATRCKDELNEMGQKYSIAKCNDAPAMTEFSIEVKNIADANTVINNLS